MTTRKRFREKYRLQLREKDHEPMHVHLVGGEVSARICLQTLRVTHGGIPPGLRKEVMAWVESNQQELIKEWIKCHRFQ